MHTRILPTASFPSNTPLHSLANCDILPLATNSCSRKEVNADDLRLFKVASMKSGKQPTDPQQTDVPLSPDATLQLHALQWLYEQPIDNQIKETQLLSSVFPNGPHGSDLDIIIANMEGMIFQLYLTDFVSVLEMTKGLGDSYDMYDRKLMKCAHVLAYYRCLPFLFML